MCVYLSIYIYIYRERDIRFLPVFVMFYTVIFSQTHEIYHAICMYLHVYLYIFFIGITTQLF